MQRKSLIVAALLVFSIGLSGCGQPLPIAAGNSAAQPQSLATATAGLPASSAAPDVPTIDTGALASNDPNTEVPPASAPGTDIAPPPASDAPPAPIEAAVTPTVNPDFAGATLPGVEDRWRYIQLNRTPFESVRTYTTSTSQTVWWYDPRFGQNVRLGEINGDFPVQATFRFRGQEVSALEVPYEVNQSFGFTLPEAILNRMQDAGVGAWAETFVYDHPAIQPK